MATITLKYNPKNRKAQKALEFMLSLGVFETYEDIPALDESLKEAREGKVHEYKSVDELFEKLG